MDYYEIMGFEDRMDMNQDSIKLSYKKLVIVFHPDKLCNQNPTEESKQLWHKIQDAFTTLTDDRKRYVYDATLEFDDSIPESFDPTTDNFFDTFERYFKINSYWSKLKPVPLLGSLEDSN